MTKILSSVVIRGPKRTISVILAKTDNAIIYNKTNYAFLIVLMSIMFGMYTYNSLRNDNVDINLHDYIIRGHRGQKQTSKSY